MKHKQHFFKKETEYNKDFIISEANIIAYNALFNSGNDSLGCMPYPNFLIVIGPNGSGKTFLSNKWAKSNNAIYFNVKDKAKIELHQYIVIDNISNIDEKDALYVFNYAHNHKKSLLITATNIDSYQIKDLGSRIKACRSVKLNIPDISLIKNFIHSYAISNNLKFPADYIEHISHILPRNLTKIRCFLEFVNYQSLSYTLDINKKMIDNILSKFK